MHTPRDARGYTLIVVALLLAVLMILGAGAMRMAQSEIQGAQAYSRAAAMTSCARAAREVLAAQLQFPYGIHAEFSLEVPAGQNDVALDLASGHDVTSALITGFAPVSDSELGPGRPQAMPERMTNDMSSPGAADMATGAQVTARCRDSAGRTHEVEFLVRFGLN